MLGKHHLLRERMQASLIIPPHEKPRRRNPASAANRHALVHLSLVCGDGRNYRLKMGCNDVVVCLGMVEPVQDLATIEEAIDAGRSLTQPGVQLGVPPLQELTVDDLLFDCKPKCKR